ncbi:hypothetical protein CHUAL_012835 [Chamberlinius hualienensis]
MEEEPESNISNVDNPGRSNWSVISYDEPLTAAAVQRIVTLCVLMLVTLVGNVIIIASLTCSRYSVRGGRTSSRVNIFIVNLAVGDLSVCGVTMSGELLLVVFGEWLLGNLSCKLLMYAQIVALASTIFILLAMSYDRYLAICQPLRFKSSVSRAKRTIALAWLAAFLLALPQLFIFLQVQHAIRPDGKPVYACRSLGYTAWWQRRLYFSLLTIFILLLPAAIIIFCYVNIVRVVWSQGSEVGGGVEYRSSNSISGNSGCNSAISLRKTGVNGKQMSRAKVRTIKLTLCIIVAFVTCWSPYFVVHNLRVHTQYRLQVPETVLALVETLALVNSALNPIVYGCFNLRVKKALRHSCCSALVREGAHTGCSRLEPPKQNKMSSTTIVMDELSSTYAQEMDTNNGSSPINKPKLKKGSEYEWTATSGRNKNEIYELKKRNGNEIRNSALFHA